MSFDSLKQRDYDRASRAVARHLRPGEVVRGVARVTTGLPEVILLLGAGRWLVRPLYLALTDQRLFVFRHWRFGRAAGPKAVADWIDLALRNNYVADRNRVLWLEWPDKRIRRFEFGADLDEAQMVINSIGRDRV